VSAAQPEDCLALHRLIHDHAVFEEASATVSLHQVADVLANRHPPASIIVARMDQELVGYASLTEVYSMWHGKRWLHLDCLFVRAQDRSLGIGARLMAAVRSIAANSDALWVEWQTPSWNEAAIRFYRREGATVLPKVRLQLSA
jgi:GNAT superfamily N-acetyltransferase